MIFDLSVTAMDLHIVAVIFLFYGAVKGAKEALRTGVGDIVTVPENSSEENPSKVLALVIVEEIEESEETNEPMTYEDPILPWIERPEVILPWIERPEIMLPWIESVKPKAYDEDSSDESNSEEDSGTETDTDSESNYYHEDDYLKDRVKTQIKLLDFEKNNLEPLRKRWKSCQKTASTFCRKACVASYKNACKQQKCKSKLKKLFKKQCKKNCNDFFYTI